MLVELVKKVPYDCPLTIGGLYSNDCCCYQKKCICDSTINCDQECKDEDFYTGICNTIPVSYSCDQELADGCCCLKKNCLIISDVSLNCEEECQSQDPAYSTGACINPPTECLVDHPSGELLDDNCCCWNLLTPCTLTYPQCVAQNCQGVDYQNCCCTQCQAPGRQDPDPEDPTKVCKGRCEDDSDCSACCKCLPDEIDPAKKFCSKKEGCADCWSCDTAHDQCPGTNLCCSKPSDGSNGCCELDPTKCADDPACLTFCCTPTTDCNFDGIEGQKICSTTQSSYFCECLRISDGTCQWWHQQCADSTQICQPDGTGIKCVPRPTPPPPPPPNACICKPYDWWCSSCEDNGCSASAPGRTCQLQTTGTNTCVCK